MKHVCVLNSVTFLTVIFLNFAAFPFWLSLTAFYFPAYTSCSSNLLMHGAILEHFSGLCVNLNLG